jgi:hypothetical protein
MAPVQDLGSLLDRLEPDLRAGRFVFSSVDVVPPDVHPVVTVHEDEGTTAVVEQDEADAHRLHYDFVASMITLRVNSALGAVGLTSAVSSALAEAGISCNVVAGLFHDHLFVPFERAQEALDLLRALSGGCA